MSNDLEKFKLRERIKILMFKHRGSVFDISNELSLPVDYIQREISKIRKEESKDVSKLISNTLMTHLFEGHKQRIIYLTEMIKSLDNQEMVKASDCCKAPIRIEMDVITSGVRSKCSACSNICNPVRVNHIDVYDLKMKILTELRAEDQSLVSFSEKMGYSNKEPEIKQPMVKQDFFILSEQKEISGDEKEVRDLIKNMPPPEREKLRKTLVQKIIDISNNDVVEKVQ